MKEYREYQLEVGFDRNSKSIFDEIEQTAAFFFRDGWEIEKALADESLGHITLFFVREIDLDKL